MKNFLLSASVFALLDAIAMSVFMKSFAIKSLRSYISLDAGNINVNVPCAVVVYLAMTTLSSVFLAPKILELESLGAVVGIGFLFGICSFAIFDFTNGALFKEYPLSFMLVDTFWGGVLFAVSSVVMYKFNS